MSAACLMIPSSHFAFARRLDRPSDIPMQVSGRHRRTSHTEAVCTFLSGISGDPGTRLYFATHVLCLLSSTELIVGGVGWRRERL